MSHRQRVLVVDDEKLVCESCLSVLSEEGYDVDTTMSARDGLRRLDDGQYDLLLADIRMPDMDGMELMEGLKAGPLDMPVVVITGFPSVDTAVRTIELGAMEYLTKPFTPDELAEAVRRAFVKHAEARAGRSTSGTAGVVDGAAVSSAIEAASAPREDAVATQARAGMITVDLNKCMACWTCVLECGLAHTRGKDADGVTICQMVDNARVQVESVGTHCVPIRCRQCEDPPCVKACPSGAIRKLGPNLPVVVDSDLCIGCKNCVLACPFGCIYVNGASNMIVKCDHCLGVVGPGEEPVCVQSCPADALSFVSVDETVASARQRAARGLVEAAESEPEGAGPDREARRI